MGTVLQINKSSCGVVPSKPETKASFCSFREAMILNHTTLYLQCTVWILVVGMYGSSPWCWVLACLVRQDRILKLKRESQKFPPISGDLIGFIGSRVTCESVSHACLVHKFISETINGHNIISLVDHEGRADNESYRWCCQENEG
jgi:hypothetical protein